MDEKPENLRRPPREDDNRKILLLPETRMEKFREAEDFARSAEEAHNKASLAADKAMDAWMEDKDSMSDTRKREAARTALIGATGARFEMMEAQRRVDLLREETGEMIRLYNVALAGVYVALLALGCGSEGQTPDRDEVAGLLDKLDDDFVENGPPKSDDFVAVGRQLLGLIRTE